MEIARHAFENCEGRLADGKYALDAIGSNRINQQYTESDHVHLWNGFAICRNEAEIVCVWESHASELLQLSENDGGDGKQTKRITKNVWHRSGMVFAQALANVHMRYYRRTYPKSIYCQLYCSVLACNVSSVVSGAKQSGEKVKVCEYWSLENSLGKCCQFGACLCVFKYSSHQMPPSSVSSFVSIVCHLRAPNFLYLSAAQTKWLHLLILN